MIIPEEDDPAPPSAATTAPPPLRCCARPVEIGKLSIRFRVVGTVMMMMRRRRRSIAPADESDLPPRLDDVEGRRERRRQGSRRGPRDERVRRLHDRRQSLDIIPPLPRPPDVTVRRFEIRRPQGVPESLEEEPVNRRERHVPPQCRACRVRTSSSGAVASVARSRAADPARRGTYAGCDCGCDDDDDDDDDCR